MIKSKYEQGELVRDTLLATIYQGQVIGSSRQILIWAYKPAFLSVEKAKTLFEICDKLMAISHPTILSPLDYDYNGSHFYVIYDATGLWCSYHDYLVQSGFPAQAEALKVVSTVISGLKVLEQNGLIAGQLNLDSIFLTDQRDIRLINNMIPAILLSEALTELEVIEDCIFLSPEFLLKQTYSTRMDVYSVGMLMYFLLTHQWPYLYSAKLIDLKKALFDPLPEFLSLMPTIPDSLVALIEACLAKDPTKRIGTIEEVEQFFLSGQSPVVPQEGPTDAFFQILAADIDRSKRHQYRHRMKWMVTGVGILLVLFGIWLPYKMYVDAIPNVQVPNVVGMDLAQAQEVLKKHHLSGEVAGSLLNPKIKPGAIIEMKPAAGRSVKQDRVIQLMISKGASSLQLPALSGQSLEFAKKIADQAGVSLNITSYEYSETAPKNQVLSQDPPPGKSIEAGDTIGLTVSKGYPVEIEAKPAGAFIHTKIKIEIPVDWHAQEVRIEVNSTKYLDQEVEYLDHVVIEKDFTKGSVIQVYFNDKLVVRQTL